MDFFIVHLLGTVAFTPKGGCPLKRETLRDGAARTELGSIHPQGWVPVETNYNGWDKDLRDESL